MGVRLADLPVVKRSGGRGTTRDGNLGVELGQLRLKGHARRRKVVDTAFFGRSTEVVVQYICSDVADQAYVVEDRTIKVEGDDASRDADGRHRGLLDEGAGELGSGGGSGRQHSERLRGGLISNPGASAHVLRRSPLRRSYGAVVVVGIFILSGLAAATTHPTLAIGSGTVPLSSAGAANGGVASEEIVAAESSLAAGMGPAGNRAWVCSSPSAGGSAYCGASPISASSGSPGWSSLTPPPSRLGAAMTYDTKDGYVLLFGGGNGTQVFSDTWKFAGGFWTKLSPSKSPSARLEAAITYDAKDGYVLLFGGYDSFTFIFLSDTWKFAAGAWTLLSPTTSPSPRDGASMTYDAKDGYVVLFGGNLGGTAVAGDTWKFVKGEWTLLTPTTAPSARSLAGISYDSKDGYVVLFGGATETQSTIFADTWKFVGGEWTLLSPTTSPKPRLGAAMTYDAKDGYVLLFGGYGGGVAGWFSDTWKFVGGAWTKLTPSTAPSARELSAGTFDTKDGYVLLFGGSNTVNAVLSDTWKFVKVSWTNLSSPLTISPAARYLASMTYDATDGYVVLFGGINTTVVFGDTWKFVGGAWTHLMPASPPQARFGASMTYDAADGYVVLFGGEANSGYLADTWKFVGGVWTELFPAMAPSGRYGAPMTYDAKDGYAVLFGGYNAGGFLSDTWKFVGGVWSMLTPATAPSARYGAAMTYDAKDDYVVLFGGFVGSSPFVLSDTWKFVAGVWTKLSPSKSPPARDIAGLAYDAAEGYVVLFGGAGKSPATLSDTWKFVGGKWSELSSPQSPPARIGSSLTYDGKDTYLVLFGGYSPESQYMFDTWIYA